MSSFAGMFKSEIRRLARKEIRAEMASTRKATVQYRRDIADLKRKIREQEQKLKKLERGGPRAGRSAAATETEAGPRFSPKWIKAHRERLGISAADYADLVGVSALTIYNWEKGKTRPAAQQLAAWGEIRNLGKREALRRLESE